MANYEACELYIEQQIQEGLEEGQTPYYIGKHLSEWIEKLFEAKINPTTIQKRAERKRAKFTTNVAKKSKPTENIENTTPEIIKNRHPQGGGKREGSGRPPIEKPNSDKNQMLIELNKKIAEYTNKKEEQLLLKKQTKEYIKKHPDLQASLMYGIILGAIRIIEGIIDESTEKNTETFIPGNKLIELSNRWQKISLFINTKIEEAKRCNIR